MNILAFSFYQFIALPFYLGVFQFCPKLDPVYLLLFITQILTFPGRVSLLWEICNSAETLASIDTLHSHFYTSLLLGDQEVPWESLIVAVSESAGAYVIQLPSSRDLIFILSFSNVCLETYALP